MKPSLHFLTNRLFDYAGLFPPAQLPLETALKNYFLYLNHPYSEALGKFILPASKCRECVEIVCSEAHNFLSCHGFNVSSCGLTAGSGDRPFPLSILLSQAPHADKIEDFLIKDFEDVAFFIQNAPPQFQIFSYEISFPKEFYVSDDARVLNVFKRLDSAVKPRDDTVMPRIGTGIPRSDTLKPQTPVIQQPCEIFCELPFLSPEIMSHFLSLVDQHNASQNSSKIFIKLRTGGVKKEHVPTVQALAGVICHLAKLRIPFKVTAGLHVPVPNFNPSVGAKMHGFLNVLIAAMIVFSAETTEVECSSVETILENLDYANLSIQENGIHLTMRTDIGSQIKTTIQTPSSVFFSNDTIQKFRRHYFKGIGSCEFLEPLEHLQNHYPNAWEL